MKYVPSIAFDEMSGSAKGVTAAKSRGRKYIRNRGYGGSTRTSGHDHEPQAHHPGLRAAELAVSPVPTARLSRSEMRGPSPPRTTTSRPTTRRYTERSAQVRRRCSSSTSTSTPPPVRSPAICSPPQSSESKSAPPFIAPSLGITVRDGGPGDGALFFRGDIKATVKISGPL